jgi:hypothetical protein
LMRDFGVVSPRLNDVWALTLSNPNGSLPAQYAWQSVTPTGVGPGPREATMHVYDPVNARMVIWGGARTEPGPICSVYSDSYSLNLPVGGTPSWVAGPSAPSTRLGGATVYDPVGQRMLVFGGSTGVGCGIGSNLNDVVELSLGPTMAFSTPTVTGTPPTARTGEPSFAAYDSHAQRMLAIGGQSNVSPTTGATYALGMAGTLNWSTLNSTTALSPGRFNHGTVYDSARRRLIVVGGANSDGSAIIPQQDFVWALPVGCL